MTVHVPAEAGRKAYEAFRNDGTYDGEYPLWDDLEAEDRTLWSKIAAAAIIATRPRESMRPARDLLRLLAEKWPPDGGCCHSLTLSDGGYGESPGEVKISIRIDGAWDAFFVDETDLEKPAPRLVAEIEALMKARDLPAVVASKEIFPDPTTAGDGAGKRGDGNCV